ncbi:glycosyltransferase [Leekyejoonella antrihumi]|uniref:Glycosyltransferase family 2 protein n=1 Tax=Leekyejoonella antrihumi TaxID=1660198 RepID=A0A563DY90_9MICO|nr:glycosyltransferase [Leekyejoonella antrihumi]TWP35089.1 glycosyltransferase family 2 protein [Leekyejoonella antrihumi]
MTQPSTVVGSAGCSASDADDTGTQLKVTTLLVVQQGFEPWIDQTLAALIGQQRRPERLVVVDATAERLMPDRIAADADLHTAFPSISVVTVPSGTPFAAVVDTAVDALPEPGEDAVVARRPRKRARTHKIRPRDKHEWLWLLHEDSVPEASALADLVRVVGHSSRIGVAGCKITRLQDRRRLVNVGIDLTRTGRHVGATMLDEPDQGQHDDRRDVLAVSSAGMMVRRDVYTRLGGFDPAFDGDGDGLDLCWRAHLSGHQVIVVPAAVVHQDLASGNDTPRSPRSSLTRYVAGTPTGEGDRPAPRSPRTLRRHRQVALARCSLLGMPVMAVWTTLTSLLLALLFLLLKRPRRAGAEVAQATAPLGIVRVLGARLRFMRRASARRRHLRALFVPLSGATRSAMESLHDAVAIEDARDDESSTPESGPAQDDVDEMVPVRSTWFHRTVTNPGLWAVLLLAAASAVMWRELLTTDALRGAGSGLTGGELRPFATDADGIWAMWRDGWQGTGLGHANVPTPYLPVLAALAWVVQWIPGISGATTGATVVAWLLLLTMPLSGAAAYRAARTATHARWPRAAAALAWASLATVTTAVSGGRLGPAVAHILLPFALAGIFEIGRRRASAPVTFGTVLAVAGVGAFAPAQLVLLSAAALVVVVIGPGWARLRGLIVAVLPWALLAPWTRSLIRDDWRAVLAGPGQLDAGHGAGPQPWQLAMLHPGGPGSYLVLVSVPVLAFGVLGLLRSGRGRVQTALILLAAVGLAAGLAAPRIMLVRGPDGVLSPWSGTALDVLAAALLGMALLGSRTIASLPRRAPAPASDSAVGPDPVDGEDPVDDVDDSAPPRRRWGLRTAMPGLVGLALLLGLGMTGVAAWSAPVKNLHPAASELPGIADEPVHGSRQVRALSLTVGADGVIDYQLDGAEQGLPVSDLTTQRPTGAGATAGAVARLLGPPAGGAGQTLAEQLNRLAIQTVVVRGLGSTAQLTQSLQATGILTSLRAGRGVTVWRVAPLVVGDGARTVDASRVTLYSGGQPALELPSTSSHSRSSTTVPQGATGRMIVLSEGRGWASVGTARLNGHPLQATTLDGLPAYRLGASGGHLVIDPGVAFSRLRLVQVVLLILCLFLAVPFGNRRSRRLA